MLGFAVLAFPFSLRLDLVDFRADRIDVFDDLRLVLDELLVHRIKPKRKRLDLRDDPLRIVRGLAFRGIVHLVVGVGTSVKDCAHAHQEPPYVVIA